jgi:hypothetical protein
MSLSLPKHLQAMSEDEILLDQANFKTALELVPELKIARTERNHAEARAWICLRYGWATNAPYTEDSYSVFIAANHTQMDHIPEPVIEKYRDDTSGSRRENPDVRDVSGPDPIEVQDLRSAKRELQVLEQELRYDPPIGKKDPRVLRRDELLSKLDDSPFFAVDGADRDRKAKKFLTKPKSDSALVQLPLETPDHELAKYSATQIKDLLARRKEAARGGS